MIPKAEKQAVYTAFEPLEHASLALNFLTQMTDPALDGLPYGLFAPLNNPPFAEHNRIDDAELVASWFEGISCCREMLGTNKGADVEEALGHLLLNQGWDAASGLRFPTRRPWTPDLDYVLVPEMAAVLSALNRLCQASPGDKLAEKRAAGLVAGLAACVVETKQRFAGFGIFDVEDSCRMFPGDVFVQGKGFVPGVGTGFSDWMVRCCTLIAPWKACRPARRPTSSSAGSSIPVTKSASSRPCSGKSRQDASLRRIGKAQRSWSAAS